MALHAIVGALEALAIVLALEQRGGDIRRRRGQATLYTGTSRSVRSWCSAAGSPSPAAAFGGTWDVVVANGLLYTSEISAGLRVTVATLPPGEDPDTLAARGGRPAVEAILGDAIDVCERKLQLLDVVRVPS